MGVARGLHRRVGRPRRLAVAWALTCVAGPARADTDELAVRAAAVVRHGSGLAPGAGIDGGLAVGGAVQLCFGLSFHWSVCGRYQLDRSFTRRDALDPPIEGREVRWLQGRHLVTAGAAWAWSDALTPVVGLEVGVAVREAIDPGVYVVEADARESDLRGRSDVVPAARVTVGWEWKPLDAWGVAPAVFGEWAGAPDEGLDGLGVGAALWVAWYRYL
jgi:hypothetical protein